MRASMRWMREIMEQKALELSRMPGVMSAFANDTVVVTDEMLRGVGMARFTKPTPEEVADLCASGHTFVLDT